MNNNIPANTIGLNIVKIKSEDISISGKEYIYQADSFFERKKPANFYLYIFFHSFFQKDMYLDGLECLAGIAKCFLSYGYFSAQGQKEMIQLGLDDFNIFIEEEGSSLGDNITKNYYPSLLYKVGLIHIHPERTKGTIAAVTKI